VLLLRGPLQIGPQGFAWYQVDFTSSDPSFDYEQAEASRHDMAHEIVAEELVDFSRWLNKTFSLSN
jgi:phospholipase/carboxylesterase